MAYQEGKKKRPVRWIPNYPLHNSTVITLEPRGKASFVYSCVQARLMNQYKAK